LEAQLISELSGGVGEYFLQTLERGAVDDLVAENLKEGEDDFDEAGELVKEEVVPHDLENGLAEVLGEEAEDPGRDEHLQVEVELLQLEVHLGEQQVQVQLEHVHQRFQAFHVLVHVGGQKLLHQSG